MTLFDPLVLPNGAVIPNRPCKGAREEDMSIYDHASSAAHCRLYRSWAEGGLGLVLSGNVMIDRRALTGPGGVIPENDEHLDRFCAWARIVATARVPLMVTGGICRREVAQCVLAGGASMVGMASALAIEPDLPKRWQQTDDVNPEFRPITWRRKVMAARANMTSIKYQMRTTSLGKMTNPNASPLLALNIERLDMAKRTRQHRRWMAAN